MGEIRLRGPGAAGTLARVLTRPVSDLPVGQGRYALMCAEDGTDIDDAITVRLGAEDFWVVVNAATREDDVGWIESYAIGACDVDDESDAAAKLDLQGPASSSVLGLLCDVPADLACIRRFEIVDGIVARVTPVRMDSKSSAIHPVWLI